MIVAINLLPYRQARRAKKANVILASWAGTAVTMVILLFLIHLQVTDHLDMLNAQVKKNDATIAKLDIELGEVKDINELKTLIESKLKIVDDLKKSRNIPVRLIDDIIRAVPDKAWLSSLQLKGENLKLQGMAQSNAVVADLMDNLNASPLIDDVKLAQVTLGDAKASRTTKNNKSFALDAKVSIPGEKKPGADSEESKPGQGKATSKPKDATKDKKEGAH
ncbi:MAG: hypothetical protein HW380_124 [Magnetococcales bacterium]|nr:hypothetical protein [Magnetococcales bacterium]HIJ83405.1 hypothetical protein [Magnetococcales bacterium]